MGIKAVWLAHSEIDVTATHYMPCNGSGVAASETTETDIRQVVGAAGSIKELRVRMDAAIAADETVAVTLMVDGSATALTCTIPNSGQSASDLVNSVAVSAGAKISLRLVPTGSPTDALDIMTTLVYEADGASICIPGGTTDTSVTADEFAGGIGVTQAHTTSLVAKQRNKIPIAGTITAFYIELTTTGIGAGESWAISIYKNGSIEASSTITKADATATLETLSVTGLSIAIAAGDDIAIHMNETGSGTITKLSWGIAFTPTTAGQSFFSRGSDGSLISTSAASYLFLNGNSSTVAPADSAEDDAQWPMPACTVKSFGATFATAPGSGNSWDFMVRKSGDTAINPQMAGTAVTCEEITDVAYAADDLLSVQVTPVSSPTAPGAEVQWWGILYIEPPASDFTAEIDPILRKLTSNINLSHQQLVTIAPVLRRVLTNINVAQPFTTTLVATLAGVAANLNVSHRQLAEVDVTLAPVSCLINLSHQQQLSVAPVLRPAAASLNAVMVPDAALGVTLRKTTSSLNAAQPFTLAVAALLAHTLAGLNAATSNPLTVAVLLRRVLIDLAAAQPYTLALDTDLRPVASALNLSKIDSLTVALTLQRTLATINAQTQYNATLAVVLARVLFGMTATSKFEMRMGGDPALLRTSPPDLLDTAPRLLRSWAPDLLDNAPALLGPRGAPRLL